MAAKNIVVYVSSWCGWCQAARRLLDAKGVEYRLVDVDAEPGLRAKIARASGRSTVPQTFVDDEPFGGYDDLVALEREGRLDELLGLT